MTVEEVLVRLEGVQGRPPQWTARCPAHEDISPSLSIREGSDGVILLKCHAGCDVRDIVQALGLRMHDLFPPRRAASPWRRW